MLPMVLSHAVQHAGALLGFYLEHYFLWRESTRLISALQSFYIFFKLLFFFFFLNYLAKNIKEANGPPYLTSKDSRNHGVDSSTSDAALLTHPNSR